MGLVANFTLNNESLDAQFDISEIQNFDALFQIDSGLSVVGEGVINVVTTNGVATISSTNFTFEQGIASNTWVIEHNLNKMPTIFVVDSTNRVQIPDDIIYNSENVMTVIFLAAFAGKAYLN